MSDHPYRHSTHTLPGLALAAVCGLLAACASHTRSVEVVRAPTEPLQDVCVLAPIVLDKVSILIQAPGAVTERNRDTAQVKVREAVAVYRAEFQNALSARLRAHGLDAIACVTGGSAGRNRIAAYVQSAYVGNTSIGQKTDLGIQVALQHGPSGDWVWRGNFSTGNMVAGPSGPDATNVAAFADNIVAELRSSGWVKSR